jgi:DNA-binding GntR family transcriptional regulator
MAKSLALQPVDGSFSLKGHIYEVLKASIMELDIYDPETQLRMDERTLAEQLGISRTPLREAIMRLEQEGFVETQPRRGVFIRRKSREEVLEMVEMWAALESMAARIACQRAGDGEIAGLRAIAGRYGPDDARAELGEYSEANIAFHSAILRLSANKRLIDTAEALLAHLKPVRRRAMADPERAGQSVVDHGDIIAAIEAREADRAERLVREHTLRLRAYLGRHWDAITGTSASETA